MLADKPFRKKVIAKIQDPVVKSFWVNEFAGYADKFAAEAVSPIQNKVGQFLSSSLIRNIVGQVKSSIDMRDIMDQGKILIMNLSKGRIGEDNSALLGAMMITKIQLAAMSRVNVPENERKDFYLYIDEFQNFTTESFANILSEARKYRLNLIMAHQYIEQLGETVKAAVFGNIGTLAVFRVGAADAEELVPEFSPIFTEEDIVNLPKFEFYIKLMIDGISSDPFSARGLPPLPEGERTNSLEKVIKVTRERYAQQREVVEEKISRWHENKKDDLTVTSRKNKKRNAPERPKRTTAESFQKNKDTKDSKNISDVKNKDIYKHETFCSRCGKATKTSFVPDGLRPVYCKECLSLAKKEKRNEVEARRQAKAQELKKIAELEKKPGISLNKAIEMQPVDFKNINRRNPQNKPDRPEQKKMNNEKTTDKNTKEEEKHPTQTNNQETALALDKEIEFE
jgi:CxxC-x17-CxxC domain-containing protein